MAALDDDGSLDRDRRGDGGRKAAEEEVESCGGHPPDETGMVREVGDEDEGGPGSGPDRGGAEARKAMPAALAEVDRVPTALEQRHAAVGAVVELTDRHGIRLSTALRLLLFLLLLTRLILPSFMVGPSPHRLEPK